MPTKRRTLESCGARQSNSTRHSAYYGQRLHHGRPVHRPPRSKPCKSYTRRARRVCERHSTGIDTSCRPVMGLW